MTKLSRSAARRVIRGAECTGGGDGTSQRSATVADLDAPFRRAVGTRGRSPRESGCRENGNRPTNAARKKQRFRKRRNPRLGGGRNERCCVPRRTTPRTK